MRKEWVYSIYHTTQFHSWRCPLKWAAHVGCTERGVVEQIIYFLQNLLSLYAVFFLLLSPFIGSYLSLGKSLLCLQQPDFRNRKEGKVFSLSVRVRERGNVVRDWKLIHMYVHVDTNFTHIQGNAVQMGSSWGSNFHDLLNFPSFLFPNSEAPRELIIFMSQPITHLVNSFVNLPCLPLRSSALVMSQGKEKVSHLS